MSKGLVFTYLLAYGGAVVAVLDPFYGLLAYIAVSILQPRSLWFWLGLSGNYARIVGVALLIGWVLHGLGTWRFGKSLAVILALAGYFVWTVLTACLAEDQVAAWGFVEFLAKILLPFLVGMTTIDSVRKLKLLGWTLVLCEGYLAYEFNLSYLAGYNRVWEEGFNGMDNNYVAVAMVMALGLAFFLALDAERWWQKLVAFGCSAMMAHVVLLTFSRGGMLAMGVVGIAGFLLLRKRPHHYVAFALAALLLARLAGPQVVDRFLTTFAKSENRDSSAATRLKLWSDCLDSISEQPLLGVGPRNWPNVAITKYHWEHGVNEAHNLWLQTTAETGVIGLALLASFYGLCLIRLWPLARERQPVADPWLYHAGRMVVVALLGFFVASQFVTIEVLEFPFFTVLFGAAALKLASVASTQESVVSGHESAAVPSPLIPVTCS